jgi:hypothetical protein
MPSVTVKLFTRVSRHAAQVQGVEPETLDWNLDSIMYAFTQNVGVYAE